MNKQNLDPSGGSPNGVDAKISFRRSPFYQRERSKYYKLSKTNLTQKD